MKRIPKILLLMAPGAEAKGITPETALRGILSTIRPPALN